MFQRCIATTFEYVCFSCFSILFSPPALAQITLLGVTMTTTAAQPTLWAGSTLCAPFIRCSLIVEEFPLLGLVGVVKGEGCSTGQRFLFGRFGGSLGKIRGITTPPPPFRILLLEDHIPIRCKWWLGNHRPHLKRSHQFRPWMEGLNNQPDP